MAESKDRTHWSFGKENPRFRPRKANRPSSLVRPLSCAIAFTALAGCSDDKPKIDPDDVPPAGVFTKAAHRPVTREQALAFFKDVCVDTAPDFALAPAVLATKLITQNKRSGTYFHNRFDMSAKLTPSGCSVVAGGAFTEADVSAFEALSPRVKANEPIQFGGRPYISAVYTRP